MKLRLTCLTIALICVFAFFAGCANPTEPGDTDPAEKASTVSTDSRRDTADPGSENALFTDGTAAESGSRILTLPFIPKTTTDSQTDDTQTPQTAQTGEEQDPNSTEPYEGGGY